MDANAFKNQFSDNTYIDCNNIRRGAIYHLENGARLRDSHGDYRRNSALEGGIAYLSGDGTYLQID